MPYNAMCRYIYGKVSNLQTSKVMKRLELSCLPINLEVGETMEVIDESGKHYLIRCEQAESNNSLCDGCFFYKINSICNYVKCSERERNQEVRYVELQVKNEIEEEEREMKTLTIDELEETEEIKVGETFIYVDGFNKEHKIKVQPMKHLTIEETCKKCAFNGDSCCLVACSSFDRQDEKDVYFEELD